MTAPGQGTPVLSLRNYSKSFASVRVLSGVDLDVLPGQIHALLGQNGSGKSTLIKCLAGVHTADGDSEAAISGSRLPHLYPPSQARQHGLSFVHQDLGLIPDLSVMENIGLTNGFATSRGTINWRRQRQTTQALLDRFEVGVRARDLVRHISPIQRTMVTIARAIGTGTDIAPLQCLVLDEPTASLPDADAQILFRHLETLSSDGVGILYVSHRLSEILTLASVVTVLISGRDIGTYPTTGKSDDDLIRLMLGGSQTRWVAESAPAKCTRRINPSAPPALKVHNLRALGVDDATFTIAPGEIVGVAGLAGSGRSRLAKTLFGAEPTTGGSIEVGGVTRKILRPRDAKRAGLALVPEDRRGEGCVLSLSTGFNVTLTGVSNRSRLGWLSTRRERQHAKKLISLVDIRPDDPDRPMVTLSGGNQQKAVIAKWLDMKPALLILDEPTQGIDVAAKRDVYTLLMDSANQGTAILMIDSEFENLARLCDRVLIMRNRRVIGELSGKQLTFDNLVASVFQAASPLETPTETPATQLHERGIAR